MWPRKHSWDRSLQPGGSWGDVNAMNAECTLTPGAVAHWSRAHRSIRRRSAYISEMLPAQMSPPLRAGGVPGKPSRKVGGGAGGAPQP